jgi:hypothetical protein
MHADRKSPSTVAIGFRSQVRAPHTWCCTIAPSLQMMHLTRVHVCFAVCVCRQVKKFLLVVQLLLGEVPERSVFQHEDFKLHLKAYFELTQVGQAHAHLTPRESMRPCLARPSLALSQQRLAPRLPDRRCELETSSRSMPC